MEIESTHMWLLKQPRICYFFSRDERFNDSDWICMLQTGHHGFQWCFMVVMFHTCDEWFVCDGIKTPMNNETRLSTIKIQCATGL